MADEDELPEELDKLEITPNLPQVKLLDYNLPIQLNPFFENYVKDTSSQNKHDSATEIPVRLQETRPVINCRKCRHRRASESIVDEIKCTAATTLSDSSDCIRTTGNGVLKQTLKKSGSISAGSSGGRKILLREPVLKALQTCLHPHSNVRRKLLVSAASSSTTLGIEGPLTTKGMSDFRDLIDECQNLLSEDVDFSGRLNQLSLNSRNSKNFTTLQTPKTQNYIKLRNKRMQIINTPTLASSSPTSPLTLEKNKEQPALSVNNHIFNSPISQQRSNFSPEHPPNHSRYSTSCSQQAGSSAVSSACDDVTIDELASYFDTFVHIPKKMSSMAEMMYI